jgi:hypothetical protein
MATRAEEPGSVFTAGEVHQSTEDGSDVEDHALSEAFATNG